MFRFSIALLGAMLLACSGGGGVEQGVSPDRAEQDVRATPNTDTEMVADTGAGDVAAVEIEPEVDEPEADPWESVRIFIDSKDSLANATILVGDATGTRFSHSRGKSTEQTRYAIASASKLLMAITIMRVVESGDLELTSTPSGLLPYWTTDPTDPRAEITLEHLLSFTSGFSGNSGLGPGDEALPCIEDADSSTTACAKSIYNEAFDFPPAGSTFYYGPTHMYVAAAMAMTVRDAPTWNAIFRQEIANNLGLSLLSGFLAPSVINGRPGGGALMNARDYGKILTALLAGELLSAESVLSLTADHTPSGVVDMERVPDTATLAGEWHYGLGCWRECEGADYDDSQCDEPGVISSPGAFGFYPWWDQANGHWGVIALQKSFPGASSTTAPLGAEIRKLVVEILGSL